MKRAVGLFAGIGGIELGLHRSGFETTLLCEIDDAAQRVLRVRFPGVQLVPDVCALARLPTAELVAAGFPCQDLSQAGTTAGIGGSRSGLVAQLFRLLESSDPTWVLLENVPFMLQLGGGAAMRFVISQLNRLGFRWAYRVIDTRAFGLPQRRRRVYILASRTETPRHALLADSIDVPVEPDFSGLANAFYWTEGLRGLGWAVDAVPTLKGGSGLGIPSPPAIWMPDDTIMTPDIRDAERLQGFEADWTRPAEAIGRGSRGARWKLVGNAVSVPAAEWIGTRLGSTSIHYESPDKPLAPTGAWPNAAWGDRTGSFVSSATAWPVATQRPHLADFLEFPLTPLTARAVEGFLSRAARAKLRFPEGFIDALKAHLEQMRQVRAVA